MMSKERLDWKEGGIPIRNVPSTRHAALIDALNSIPETRDYQPFMDLLRQITGSSVVNGILTLPGFPGGYVTSISGIAPSEFEQDESEYFDRHGGYNPMMAAVEPILETGRVLRASDHASFPELRRTAYFRELLHPMNADYTAGIVIESASHGTSWLSLSKPVGSLDYSEKEIALLKELSRPLQRVCRLLGEMPDRAFGWDVLDGCGIAATVVEYDLRIRWSTAAMDDLLAEESAVGVSHNVLHGNDEEVQQVLLELVRSALGAATPAHGLDAAPQRGFCDAIGNRWRATAMAGASGLPRDCILLLFRRNGTGQSPERRLISKFGLTKAEARCVIGLLQSPDGSELANRLGIGANTIKTHLRNAYRKTGTKSRVGLITRMAREGLVEE